MGALTGMFLIYEKQPKVNNQISEQSKKRLESNPKSKTAEPSLVESSIPMQEYSTKICDLNNDSKCDDLDKEVFKKSLGSCRIKDNNYYPIADADIDGCVTETDYKILFDAK